MRSSFAAASALVLSLSVLGTLPACSSDDTGLPPSAAGGTAGAAAGSAGTSGRADAAGASGAGGGAAGGPAGGGGGASKGLAPVTTSCASTITGDAHFTDATDKWELGATGLDVLGGRAMVADFDGDGYPDVLVSRVAGGTRTIVEGGIPKGGWPYRVLMNRPSEDGSHRRFVDATLASGIGSIEGVPDLLRSAQLAVAADVDNDGDLDLFQGTYTDPDKPKADVGDRSRVLLNDGKGVFSPAPASAVSPKGKERWPTTGISFADVDRDGKVDAFVGFFYSSGANGFQAQLYKGAGDGTFAYGTDAAGLSTSTGGEEEGENHRPAYGVTACDLDGDGAPELLVSAYGRQWNLLYQNDGKGTFKEIGQASGFAGDDDASFSDNQFFACYCTLDRATKPLCKDVKKPLFTCPEPADANWNEASDTLPWRNNGNTFTTVCADLDGDGRLDLYNAEIAHWWAGKGSDKSALLRNRSAEGTLSFERMVNEEIGTVLPHVGVDWNEGGIHAAAGDLDNDGRQELLVATSDYPDQYAYFFSRDLSGKFVDKRSVFGIDHPCAVGPAVADFDRDGDLDVILAASTARDCAKLWPKGPVLRFYENDASTKGTFLAVRLRGNGKDTNAAAIGARVTVRTGTQTQVREVSGGYGHMGLQQDTVTFFGLGACTVADAITVQWPNQSASIQEWANVAAGALVTLTQDDATVARFAP